MQSIQDQLRAAGFRTSQESKASRHRRRIFLATRLDDPCVHESDSGAESVAEIQEVLLRR